MKKYQRIKEILVYENKRVSVFDDQVRRPDAESDTYFRVRYKNGTTGAVVVPELPDGRLLLLKIRRYAFDDDSLEFPRGGSRREEITKDTAIRELLQETCLTANELVPIGFCRPDTSILQVEAAVFRAKLPAVAEHSIVLGEHEAIFGHQWLTRAELSKKIKDGTVRDGFTLSAFALLNAFV
jgi:ADP-ribose pyrophosphatase